MNQKAFKFLGFLVLVLLAMLSSVAETRDIEKKGKGSNPVEDEKSRGYCYRGCCVRGLLGRCKKCCAYNGQPQIIVSDADDQPMPHHKGSEETDHSGGGGGHGGGKGGGRGGHGGGKGGGGKGPGDGS